MMSDVFAEVKINSQDITLYYLSNTSGKYFQLPENSNSFQLQVTGAKEVKYEALDSYGINVSSEGLIKLATNSNRDFTIIVTADGEKYEVKVKSKDYGQQQAEDYMDRYIEENIDENLTDLEKMIEVLKFVASFNYSAESSNIVGLIFGEGADCWGSTSAIKYMGNKLGIRTWWRTAINDPGAGSGHANAASMIDGNIYVWEAGYNEKAPRFYSYRKLQGAGYYVEFSSIYQYDGEEEVVNIPESLASSYPTLKRHAFPYGYHDGSKIRIINIPATLTNIESGAIYDIPTLDAINVDENNPNYKSVDGILYSKDMKTLIAYPANKKDTTFKVPEGVEVIARYALSYNENLERIIMPSTLKKIETKGVYANPNLVKLDLNEGLEEMDISGTSFNEKLEVLVIPSTVKELNDTPYSYLKELYVLNKDLNFKDTNFNSRIKLYGYNGSTTEALANSVGATFITIEENKKVITSNMISEFMNKKYNGKEQKQNITIIDASGKMLKLNTDYTVFYKNNTDAGTATVEIKGIGSYTGLISKEFTIERAELEVIFPNPLIPYSGVFEGGNFATDVPASIYYQDSSDSSVSSSRKPLYKEPGVYTYYLNIFPEDRKNYINTRKTVIFTISGDISLLKVDSIPTQVYTGKEVKPKVVVKATNGTLVNGTDYTVEYQNNVDIGTGKVIIKGIGKFTGTIVKEFKIVKNTSIKNVSLNKTSVSIEKGKTYTLKATINPSDTTDSKKLTWKSSNTKVATVDSNGKVTAKGLGTTTITVTTSNGKKATSKITVTKVKSTSLSYSSIGNKTYTGRQLKPGITVKYGKTTLKNGKDYTVKYGSNKATGKGTVTITLKGDYTGSKTITFYITPKKVSIKTPKSTSKKTLTVYYSKTTGASGYQIGYRIKGTKKWTYITSTGASKKINKLTSKKTYEVLVRAYKTINGKKYYGPWSSTKTVKVK